MMRVGFVGLGKQGAPIAERLLAAGHPTTLWARRAEALERFLTRGAAVAPDLPALGRASDAAVRDVCLGDGGLLGGMAPGALLVIHGTVSPETCRVVARHAAERGVAVTDAPVSGGAAAAREGRLTVMAGGDAATIDACRPVFSAFAAQVFHMGALGAGQAAKALNNTLMLANLAALHDTLELGGVLGLDRAVLLEVLRASSGDSFAADAYGRAGGLAGFARGARLLAKDMGILEAMAREAGGDPAALCETGRRFLAFFDD